MYDLIRKALEGDVGACQQLYAWAYLWPRLKADLTPPAPAGTGRKILDPMTTDHDELAAILAMICLGPQPEPPDLPQARSVAISAMKRFQERLVALADQIAVERAALESKR